MKEIVINSKTYGKKICFVDDEDYDRVSSLTWTLEKGRTTFYAMHTKKLPNGKSYTVRMHQFILGILPETNGKRSVKVDHIDHNGLNNIRANIRICNNSQNGANARVYKRSQTGVKGVIKKWDLRRGRKAFVYNARIRVNNKLIDLGSYRNLQEATKAYNDAALKYFGEYAWLNPL